MNVMQCIDEMVSCILNNTYSYLHDFTIAIADYVILHW